MCIYKLLLASYKVVLCYVALTPQPRHQHSQYFHYNIMIYIIIVNVHVYCMQRE